MRLRAWCLSLALFQASSAVAASPPTSPLDLHAHLFMEDGLMSWFYHGCFNEPLRATSWSDLFFSNANRETLEKSGLGIVVISLYAHPLKSGTPRDSIRRQIAVAEQFVASHPDWIIAANPDEARKALKAGKRVLVLSLEGAADVLETEEDFREFIDQKRIRIVTLLHLTDDHLGGAAFMRGVQVIANPIAWAKSLWKSSTLPNGSPANPLGLTAEGGKITDGLLRHKVWIDLTHSSEAAQRELIPRILAVGQPLLYTHTLLQRYYKAERGLADWQIAEMTKNGGFVGLLPSHQMLDGTPSSSSDCQSDIQKLVVHFNALAENIGPDAIVVGSDFNAPVNHLKPGCASGGTAEHNGFWNIGQSSDLWITLKSAGAKLPAKPQQTIDRFLSAWEKAMGRKI